MLLAAAATTRVAWPTSEGVQEGPAEGLGPGDAREGARDGPPRGLHNPRKYTHTRPENTHTARDHEPDAEGNQKINIKAGALPAVMALILAVGVCHHIARQINGRGATGGTGAEEGLGSAPAEQEMARGGIGHLLRHARALLAWMVYTNACTERGLLGWTDEADTARQRKEISQECIRARNPGYTDEREKGGHGRGDTTDPYTTQRDCRRRLRANLAPEKKEAAAGGRLDETVVVNAFEQVGHVVNLRRGAEMIRPKKGGGGGKGRTVYGPQLSTRE
jgi:hypothetical protein